MRKFTATVYFTNPDVAPITEEEETPDKARIYALQHAKLTGAQPERVVWQTEGQDQVMLWPSQEQMSLATYEERTKS